MSWSVYRLSYAAHDLSVVCCIPPANEPPFLGVSSRETRDATRGCLCFAGPPFCCLLCSRRQVNCQINPTGQPDYFCFASTTHQFPYFYCFILSLYFLIRFSLSLSFVQSCLCLVYSFFSHNVFRNPLFYFFVLYILLRSLHFSPHLPYSSTDFLPFTFIPNPLVTTKSRFYSFPLHQVLFIFYHLTFSSDPRSFLRAFLTPLFEAKRRETTLRHTNHKIPSSEHYYCSRLTHFYCRQ